MLFIIINYTSTHSQVASTLSIIFPLTPPPSPSQDSATHTRVPATALRRGRTTSVATFYSHLIQWWGGESQKNLYNIECKLIEMQLR